MIKFIIVLFLLAITISVAITIISFLINAAIGIIRLVGYCVILVVAPMGLIVLGVAWCGTKLWEWRLLRKRDRVLEQMINLSMQFEEDYLQMKDITPRPDRSPSLMALPAPRHRSS